MTLITCRKSICLISLAHARVAPLRSEKKSRDGGAQGAGVMRTEMGMVGNERRRSRRKRKRRKAGGDAAMRRHTRCRGFIKGEERADI